MSIQSNPQPTRRERLLIIALFFLLLGVFHLIFNRFFPLPGGGLGTDNAYGFSVIFDGVLWFHNNGIFNIPWFTPSFCGGLPFYFDPQSAFFSLPQFLAFVVNPLFSFYLSFLIFAALGFWGFYCLLKNIFNTSRQAAFLGGTFFMFNGFFTYRMLAGHGVFLPFMLVPLITYCALINPRASLRENIRWTLFAGLMLTYWIQAGMLSLAIPSGIAILTLCLLFALLESSNTLKSACLRLGGAVILTTLLSAAKLTGMLAFMSHFPRSSYWLPGADSVISSIVLSLQVLFLSPTQTENALLPMITHYQWSLGRHELEYGLTFVPLLIFITAITHYFFTKVTKPRWQLKHYLILMTLLSLSLLPIILNTFTPAWNAFLKTIPVIKSSSNLFRWYVIDIPIIIAASALCIDRINQFKKNQNIICVVSITVILLTTVMTDKTYYTQNPYSPGTILTAYANLKHHPVSPQITGIQAPNPENNFLVNRNDSMTQGLSPQLCYFPTFGYRLENFPVKTLHPGSVFSEENGILNLKNPACYVYPEENHCSPGDHFTVKQIEAARTFAAYKPFHFEVSKLQKLANRINLIAIAMTGIFFLNELIQLLSHLKRRVAPKSGKN